MRINMHPAIRRFCVRGRLAWHRFLKRKRRILKRPPKQVDMQELPETVQKIRLLIIKFLNQEGTHSMLVRKLVNSLMRQRRTAWVYKNSNILSVTGDELMDLILAHGVKNIDSLRIKINETLADPKDFDQMGTAEKLIDRRKRNAAARKLQKQLDNEKKLLRDALGDFLIKQAAAQKGQ